MTRRLLGALLLLAALLPAQTKVPLANFSGAVHGVSKTRITIETDEGNLVDFDITKKTRVLRGKKPIQPEDLNIGDVVNIEARQEMLQFLVAVVITALPPP